MSCFFVFHPFGFLLNDVMIPWKSRTNMRGEERGQMDLEMMYDDL